MEIGQLCVKLAGRDAGKKCVIIDILDNNFVLIDGETRRRKCNIIHLEPLNQKLDVKKGALHEAVVETFKKMSLEARTTKPKPGVKKALSKRTIKARPKPTQKKTVGEVKEEKPKAIKKQITKKIVDKTDKK